MTQIPFDHERVLVAARAGDVARLAELLRAGVPADPPAEAPETALHAAAKEGHLDAMRVLLDAGADPLRMDEFGSAAIHRAALAGHAACVAVLIEDHGVDPNLRDRQQRTPVQEAVQGLSLETARLLIGHGVDLDARDFLGRTALGKVHDKIRNKPGVDDPAEIAANAAVADAMEALLLEAGVDPMLDGQRLCATPLMHAIEAGDLAAAERCVRADPESIDLCHFRDGTALHVAARRGAAEHVAWLLDHGANAGIAAEWRLPLQCAAEQGDLACVRLLLRAYPPALRNIGDPPALHLAARGGHAEIVDLLLEAGADPRARTMRDETARDVAANADVRERLRRAMLDGNPRPRRRPPANTAALARLLASEGVGSPRLPAAALEGDGFRPLHHAVDAAAIDVLELLLDAGAELLDYEVPEGWRAVSSLSAARRRARKRREEEGEFARRCASGAVELRDFVAGLAGGMRNVDWRHASEADLLAMVAEGRIRANAHYVDELTPLHMAAAFDMPDVVNALIDKGARLEIRTSMGEVPLTFAARRAGAETTRRLIEAGADFSVNACLMPPLHEACAAANAGAARALIEAGADVNAVASWGRIRRERS